MRCLGQMGGAEGGVGVHLWASRGRSKPAEGARGGFDEPAESSRHCSHTILTCFQTHACSAVVCDVVFDYIYSPANEEEEEEGGGGGGCESHALHA